MAKFIEHPLVHSLMGKLRDRFGEDGKAELKAEFAIRHFPVDPDRFCEGFRRLGWTVSHERTSQAIVLRFSQPPEASLPLSPAHVAATAQLVARVRRFLSKNNATESTRSFPLHEVSYRVADLAARQLRSSGLEITLVADSSARLNSLLIAIPDDPQRAGTPRLVD